LNFVVALRRGLVALGLVLALLLVGGPWALYGLGLRDVQGRPVPPAVLASPAVQTEVWQRAGSEGELEMVAINPVFYVMSAAGQSAPPPSTAFAWQVASAYTRDHPSASGPLGRHLSSTALMIWLTRHWTLGQLLSRVAEMDVSPEH